MLEMGTPLPPDEDYFELTIFLRRVIKVDWLITFNCEWIGTFTEKILQKVLDSIEKEKIKNIDESPFWNLFEQYYNFIGQEEKEQKLYIGYQRRRRVCNYKHDVKTFERDVPALEMSEARKDLELKVRESLTQIWRQLRDRIVPDTTKIRRQLFTLMKTGTQNQFNQSPDSIFSTIWSKFSREEDSNFKLERFDDLVSALVKALANSLDKIVQSFDQWFAEFMSRINETPLLKPVHYSLPGEVRCTLYWYSRDDMHSFPDVILENFYRCVKENWPKRHALVVYLHDLPGLKENCKATRLNYFKEAKKVNEVKEAVEAFARKVQKEILKEEGKGKEGGGEL